MKRRWARGDFDDLYTPERRKQISKDRRIAWARGDFDNRDNSIGLRRAHAREDFDDTSIKISEGLKRAWARGCYDGVFNNPSSIELAVIGALDDLDIDYVSQYRPDGCGWTYDVFVPDLMLLIEVDGEYWHYSEDAKCKGVPEKDAEKDNWAVLNGFDIARLRELDIKAVGARAMVTEMLAIL